MHHTHRTAPGQLSLGFEDEVEEWRPVVDAPQYAVSSRGRAMGPGRGRAKGNTKRVKPTLLLKPILNAKGYPCITIGRGSNRHKPIHVLMLEAFVCLRPPGMIGRHLDDQRTNNVLSNLAWGTYGDNREDAVRNGLAPGRNFDPNPSPRAPTPGEKNVWSKLTEAQVIEIRRRVAAGESRRELAKEFGVTKTNINHIHVRKTWRHI